MLNLYECPSVFGRLLRHGSLVLGESLVLLSLLGVASAQPGSGERPRPPNPVIKHAASGTPKALLETALERGNLARDAGRDVEAERHYKRALALDPNEARAYYALGNIYLNWSWSNGGGWYRTEARRDYEQAVRLKPDDPLAHNALGQVAESDDERIAQYKEAIRLDPEFADAHNNLGRVYLANHNFQGAVQAYEQFTRLKPRDAAGYNNLGFANFMLGNYSTAIAAYKQAIRLNSSQEAIHPNNSQESYYMLGNSYYQLGRYSESIEPYERAIHLWPIAENYNRLGDAYRAQQKVNEAIEQYKKAATLTSEVGANKASKSLGDIYFERQEYLEAIRQYRTAVTQPSFNTADNTEAQALFKLGEALLKINDQREARKVYQQLQGLDANLAERLLAEINR